MGGKASVCAPEDAKAVLDVEARGEDWGNGDGGREGETAAGARPVGELPTTAAGTITGCSGKLSSSGKSCMLAVKGLPGLL